MKEILPHNALAEYDDLSADISLMRGNRMARSIYVMTAGDGILVIVNGDGTTETLTDLVEGLIEPSPHYVTGITAAGTGVTKIRVGW